MKDILQQSNLLLWGCGLNADQLLDSYQGLEDKLAGCVDSSATLQNRRFRGRWLIESPAIVDPRKHTVIVTPENYQAIVDVLEERGFIRRDSYYLAADIEIYPALKAATQYTSHILFVLHPATDIILKPSAAEQALQHYLQLVNDRVDWLKHNPPHIAAAHAELPHYSADYIKDIFTSPNPMRRGELLYYEDYQSEYVSVSGGLRVTTDQPEVFRHRVHLVGPSHVYGFGVEDQYTLASCLQRKLNALFPDTYLVINHGVRGMQTASCAPKIHAAGIKSEDICIVWLRGIEAYREYLSVHGLPFIDLAGMVQRPHHHGEIFFDSSHLNYKGNELAAEKVAIDYFFNVRRYEQPKATAPEALEERGREIIADEAFAQYLGQLGALKVESDADLAAIGAIGAIVMNCNPFTKGHYHLINLASQMVDHLYVFIVEEDRSIFPFADRFRMVKEGVASLENVTILPSGCYIISSITFPEYFDKENRQQSSVDPALDIHLFGQYIAPALGVTVRFFGEEPLDAVTRQYNEGMKRTLPQYGVNCIEIPRAKADGAYISASQVRRRLAEDGVDSVISMVPPSTYRYLEKNEQALQQIILAATEEKQGG